MRFFLDTDDDGHWFMVPVTAREAWEEWLEAEGPISWEAPIFARPLDGHPNRITFADPEGS